MSQSRSQPCPLENCKRAKSVNELVETHFAGTKEMGLGTQWVCCMDLSRETKHIVAYILFIRLNVAVIYLVHTVCEESLLCLCPNSSNDSLNQSRWCYSYWVPYLNSTKQSKLGKQALKNCNVYGFHLS